MKKLSTRLSLIMMAMALPSTGFAQDGFEEGDEEVAAEPAPEATSYAPPPPPEPVAEEVAEEEEEEGSIMDNVTWQAFATAYYQFDVERVPNGGGEPAHRGYARNHGFGVPFVGGDFAYAGEHGGVTINLRFGEAAPLLIAGAQNYPLISNVKQAYASWFASESLSVDVGFFDTIYGAEVADEWANVNYSRGALYFLMQPFNHTGVRVNYALSDSVGLKFLVVNGNFDFADIMDVNEVPAFGAQIALAPSDNVGLAIGYATQAEGRDAADNPTNNDWSHFFDVVATIGLSDSVNLVLNTDLRFNPMLGGDIKDSLYFGASAAVGVALSDQLSLGGRVEYLYGGSGDGAYSGLGAESLITVTPTLRYMPADGIIMTLEPRLEWANEEIFFTRTGNSALSVNILAGLTARIGN
ncbi:MAG: outer membrane beta-barrel protein [Sandaracinaceae bacterium]|nr:outer membrane beta-barrel protein [Sandaracinaceae bacterium]